MTQSSEIPTLWTAYDSVVMTHLVAQSLMETLSHHAQKTPGASHNSLWPDWPSCTWEQPVPLPNPLSWLTSWNPEAPPWNNKRLIPSLPPHKPQLFLLNTQLLPSPSAEVDLTQPAISAASNKGTWTRSPSSSHLYFSHVSNTTPAFFSLSTSIKYFSIPFLLACVYLLIWDGCLGGSI